MLVCTIHCVRTVIREDVAGEVCVCVCVCLRSRHGIVCIERRLVGWIDLCMVNDVLGHCSVSEGMAFHVGLDADGPRNDANFLQYYNDCGSTSRNTRMSQYQR